MFCVKCGNQLPEGVRFCDKCGATIDSPQNVQPTPAAAAVNNATPSYEQIQQEPSKNSSYHNNVFVESDEQLLATLGNGWITNMLFFGKAKKCNALLTDKRLYLQGVFFSGSGQSMTREKYEKILDLEDITGTGFLYSTGLGILLSMLTVLILAVLGAAVLSTEGAIIGFLIGTVIVTVSYILSRETYFIIEYAGGSIRFKASIIGVADVKDFQKQIRRAKDKAKGKL